MQEHEPAISQAFEQPEIVVTAGGTRENIDDVRYIGNFSSGHLGIGMADTYARLGYSVLLLAPTDSVERFGLPEGVAHQAFTSATSLQERLYEISKPELVVHAAAVSDYTPEKFSGKLSSDEDELVVRLRRNPKILHGLRDHFGETTKIVGFKLLSGVSEATLVQTALRQIAQSRTNMCIANDLQDIGERRKLYAISADGTYRPIVGDTTSVARATAQHTAIEELGYVVIRTT